MQIDKHSCLPNPLHCSHQDYLFDPVTSVAHISVNKSAAPAPISLPHSPQDYLFDPDRYTDAAGPLPPMHIRPAGFLANERTPAEVKVRACF